MTTIIDYNTGNLCSVENALARLGCEWTLSDDPTLIQTSDRVILPGVGNAAEAMASLSEKGLVEVLKALRKPVLGICVGMQIMCRGSEEGSCKGLGIFDCHVRRFPTDPTAKVPHMGWNSIANLDGKLFKDLKGGSYVYFVHSYYPTLCPDTIATCRHGDTLFSAALKYENFYGTQFHPEKSGSIGEKILENFLSL